MIRALFLSALALTGSVLAAEEPKIAARSAAFELAGAFSANDGYKLRDGFFTASLKTGESRIFQVNLYSGNSYWFCVATAPAAQKVSVTLYDEKGEPVAIQTFTDKSRAAAGFSAPASGAFYVKINLETSDSAPSTACLIYAYK